MNTEPLENMKVLEVCGMVAGPWCTKLLADLGADVVKLEEPGAGDPSRHRPPFAGGISDPERSVLFLSVNTNKMGITLNLAEASGRELFRELLKEADILVEDIVPGEMGALGLGYDSLREINPGLIMASITPFGQTGPYNNYKAYPLNSFHASLQGYLTPGGAHFPDRSPLKQGTFVGEYESGVIATVSIMAALFWRGVSGQGQYIDCSKQEMLDQLECAELVRYPNEGWITNRGTRGYNVGGVLPCKDGYVEMTLLEEHQWTALKKMMGNPEWANDPRFEERASREQNGPEINQHVVEWLATQNKDDIYHKGQALGCTLAPYYRINEVSQLPQMKSREFFHEASHPVVGSFSVPLPAYRTSAMPCKPKRHAPLLGEHNEEVYGNWLGHDKQYLASLREGGII